MMMVIIIRWGTSPRKPLRAPPIDDHIFHGNSSFCALPKPHQSWGPSSILSLFTDTINTNWHINNSIPCEFASIPKTSKYFHQRPSRLLFTPTIRIYSSVLLLSINSSIWLSSNPAILTTATSMIFWHHYPQVLEMTVVILRCLRWPGAISLLRIPQSGARTGNRSSGTWFLLIY